MCGESLAITIPSQIAELHDIKEGDYMEFEPIGTGEFKIKKSPQENEVEKNLGAENKRQFGFLSKLKAQVNNNFSKNA